MSRWMIVRDSLMSICSELQDVDWVATGCIDPFEPWSKVNRHGARQVNIFHVVSGNRVRPGQPSAGW